jgi:hypothetical protein
VSARFTRRAVEKAIGDDRLTLQKYEAGSGSYWYFVFDDLDAGGDYRDQSEYTPRLSDMPLERWVEIGKRFLKECTQ